MKSFYRQMIASAAALVLLSAASAGVQYAAMQSAGSVASGNAVGAVPSGSVVWISVAALSCTVVICMYVCFAVARLCRDARLLSEGVKQLDCRDVRIDLKGFRYRELRICADDLADVASQVRAEQGRLTENATRDALTGLPNRRAMTERLEHEVATAKRTGWPVSMIMADLDHFKALNDTYGHQAGDFVLRRAAERMASLVRESDTVARYGGEEFAVILPNASMEQASEVAHQLRDALRCDLLIVDNQSLQVSASFGVAELHACGVSDADALMKRADVALYQAKESGRDRVVTASVVKDGASAKAAQGAADQVEQKPLPRESSLSNVSSSVDADTMALMGSTFSLLQMIPDRHRVANDMIQQVATILECRKLSLYAWDESANQLGRIASVGDSWHEEVTVPVISEELAAWFSEARASREFSGGREVALIQQLTANGEDMHALLRIPLAERDELVGLIEVNDAQVNFDVTSRQRSLLSGISLIGATALKNCDTFTNQEQRWRSLTDALCGVIQRDDKFKEHHATRVSETAIEVARELGLADAEELELLRLAAMLHDVGEMEVPKKIRQKKSSLRVHERRQIEEHARAGADLIEQATSMAELANIILHHHEHHDGTGYPDGLSGEEVPLCSRIIAVAAAYEAMTSDRAYRCKMSDGVALSRILTASGTQFDPVVVDAFMRCQEANGGAHTTRRSSAVSVA